MKLRVFLCAMLLSAWTLTPAWAEGMSELTASVRAVREKLVVLLHTDDKEKKARLVSDIQRISKDIDSQTQRLLKDPQTSDKAKDKLLDFKTVWQEFRTTRDEQIIPFVLSGDPDKIQQAKLLARTIQAERFQKMQSSLD